mmetsp:Transcript_30307/g.45705  ORF Transcript_30307/g.45705 Transcript_30307/m.45705 type:complete len:117 (-) Transcript_30307:281-631(-)
MRTQIVAPTCSNATATILGIHNQVIVLYQFRKVNIAIVPRTKYMTGTEIIQRKPLPLFSSTSFTLSPLEQNDLYVTLTAIIIFSLQWQKQQDQHLLSLPNLSFYGNGMFEKRCIVL